jgi:hypothetical protein
MAQHDYNIANQGFPAFRSDLNNALSAIQTTNSGTSRPSGAVAGQLWLDTTSPTTPTLKYYDGADDISLATIDHSANTVNWLDSTVSITGLSTTATGTVLTLSDSATTSTVNLIIDNDKEIRFREATANGTNYVSLSAPASLSADLTFTLPATDGTNGQVLGTNGSGVLSFITPASGLSWDSSVKTASTFTAVVNKGYFVDTTSNAITCTLPASATAGDVLAFSDYARNWGTNKLTLNQNSLNFQGFSSPNPEYNTSGQSVQLVYSGATKGWIPFSDDDVTNEVPQTTTISYLVIAGGAGGGSGTGGGGGAGGYRNSYSTETSGGGGSTETPLTILQGTVITLTVGGGGSAGTSNGQGGDGGSSSITGSGVSTVTSSGGGGGGGRNSPYTGRNGGSGGGGTQASGGDSAGGSGTANQGYAGGTGRGGITGQPNGGGGGAGAVGVTGVANQSGNGGVGLASSITGSSVTRGGGGGAGETEFYGALAGTGSGGGGNGGSNASGIYTGTAGTANTGGGGGGSGKNPGPNTNVAGSAGGSGVVILRMLTSKYSGTTTGSPTVTTSGSDTILTYTGTGTYTV